MNGGDGVVIPGQPHLTHSNSIIYPNVIPVLLHLYVVRHHGAVSLWCSNYTQRWTIQACKMSHPLFVHNTPAHAQIYVYICMQNVTDVSTHTQPFPLTHPAYRVVWSCSTPRWAGTPVKQSPQGRTPHCSSSGGLPPPPCCSKTHHHPMEVWE